MSNTLSSRRLLLGASALTLALAASSTAYAEGPDATPAVPAAAETTPDQKLAEGSDIVVTATRANEIAPVTASLQTTQPQSVISRSFIEDSLPATSDFNQIALISPSVSGYGNTNGPGLSESKAQIRGFQDGEYNVTYDGVPFGDTNDPTHHSNTFFPSNTIETLIVDRGPGNASQLGQATFGGNINLFSRATREDPSIEAKGSYGSYNTWLLRGVAQSGAIKALGGTEIVLSAQHISSDGARSFSPFKSNNIFGKVMIPIGSSAKLTLLATYNENDFNQPDKDGATLSQIALYGKNFSLNNDPNSQNYYKYNHTHKTTDFEIVKFEADIAPNSTFENRAYTYSYDNETLSGNDVTLFATATPQQIAAANVYTPVNGVSATAPGVPGYTKTNKYRMFGDIAKTRIDFGFGAITAGAWIEWSNTYRQQRDVNLVNGARNYVEKKVTDPVTGVATPQDIKFDQNSHTEHTEEFIELELRPLPGLKITPGFKHVDFNRRIFADYNQTTRIPQKLSNDYTADLPFATINYAVSSQLSVYGQYARGFLAPSLSVLYVANPNFSTVAPERSTNYQAGVVYHGGNLSIDADVYKIDFTNKFASITSPIPGEGVVFFNQGSVQYKGLEGQVTYALPHGFAVFANGSRNYAKTKNPGVPQLQVANAPEWTAAGGVLYKNGPIRFSLIDKYVGRQWFADPTAVDLTAASGPTSLAYYNTYKSNGYNTAIASVRYDVGPVRIGFEVNNLFNSQRVQNIGTGKTVLFDQYYYQTGRSYTGDITLTF
ncbi:MAG: TonB-dependent outer rane receptor FecA5 [Sphingomonas bacterium]|uniref:TonB-dependent receptor n=1 Tax=Sphingomonas bacterium TaxID=1895847 RepID=UPI002635C45E|nr:TonB-dependent receptor [Sphingomonas bacterium]MDB5706688.1 TonB-dependent outer rane receptor FecA5 [Sphingomonas bacterium]